MSCVCLISFFSLKSAVSIKYMAACLVWPPQWTPTPSSALTHALFLKSYFFHLHKQLLNCHLIPPPFFPPLLLNSALGMKGWHVILSTSYGARLALCEHDKEWPLVTTFNFAHWVTRSDKHSSLSTCRKKSHQHHPWTQGDCPPPRQSSGSADFHPWI